MQKNRVKKWSSIGLSALLIGGSFLPNFTFNTIHAKAAQFGNVVISEVYGGGGNSGATYKNDFIELYNPTDEDISLEGWSVQYAAKSGSFSTSTSYLTPLKGVIKAHGYYLIQEKPGSGGTVDLPNPDVTGSIAMGGSDGKVVLMKTTAAAAGSTDPNVVDFVGYGAANDKEGSGTTQPPSAAKSVERLANDSSDPTGEGAGNGNGWDTNDNASDFVLAEPNPQNSSSSQEPALVTPDPISEGSIYIKNVRDNDSSGQPKLLNDTVTVEGIVTTANNVVGSNTFYIEDGTGGINIFGSSQEVTVGSKVKVTGQVLFYRGLSEIKPVSVEVISSGHTLTTKFIKKLAVLNNYNTAEPVEGTLVKIRGKVTDVPASPSGGGYNITLTDDAGKSTIVRVMQTTGINVPDSIKKDGTYTLTGILSQYDSTSPYTGGYQIFPRNAEDVQEYFALSLEHEPITTAYKGTNVEFIATAPGAQTVTVFYKSSTETNYHALPMFKGEQDQFTAVLTASNLPQEGFNYYIEAKNSSEQKSAGTPEAPYAVKVELDTAGPEISGFEPVNNAIVETTTPDIRFQLEDPSGINFSKLSVKLDNSDVTSAVNTSVNPLRLELSSPLLVGTHTISVEAYDTKGYHSTASWSFTVAQPFTGGQHYRGTTHNHTNISHDGTGSPEDALKAGKAHGYDWFAFSDHSHDIDPELVGQDTNQRNGMPERTGGTEWQQTKDLADQYTKDDYVVFPAFEMTTTTWGHSNVFGTNNFIDRKMNSGKYQDLNQYYAWVLTYDNIAAQFNHPDMSANAFNNFMPYDQKVDKLFTMLEVGNGSGHYGYANAEKKFFSALDLGWHIAPTYGEDNHDGTWGQTLKRTVIVANDLSQNSLLHSMRNMRVYMEEDPNFQLDMLANGQYMGSIINSKTLKFDITGSDAVAESKSMPEYSFLASDYKSDDRVKKVELITNGAKVIDSIEPMTKDFSWKPEVTVTGGQQWFVVRITQMDGEQIYSSPVWTKEQDVDVRVSGLEVVGGAIVSGNPATLEAGISNLGKTALSNLTAKFYYDEVASSNLIGEGTIASVASKGVSKASVTWNNPVAGNHTLIAVVDTPTGDSPEDNEFRKTIAIKQSLGIKVMIDASHKNENTSTDPGTYKDNFTSFTKMVQREGYTVVENKAPLTADTLKDVKVLVLTHPEVDLSAAENDAVAEFVKNGGSLLLTDKSNYKNDPTINNDLLLEMGASIQINHDGIYDDSKDGNFWSDPLKSKHAVRLHLAPVANYITDRADTIEYYSGASLEKVGHEALTNNDTVTIIAKANETTYQTSVSIGYYTYDTVSDDKGGSVIPAIASEVIGDGKIIVAGMNFMNDKQMDESYNSKGNDEVAMNSINWLADRETTITKLDDARKLEDGTPVVVEGTVTTGAGVFFDAFYLQDDTGGIMAFQEVPEGSLQEGDKVRVYGHIKTFENNKELEFVSFDQDVIKIGSGEPVQPKVVKTGEATSDSNQGLLVKVKGLVTAKFDDNSYFINDGSGDVLVFTDGYIVDQSGPVPVLEVGDQLEAVGLSGSFAQGERVRVRNTKELIGNKDVTAPETAAKVNPQQPTGKNGWYQTDVSVELSANDDLSGVSSTQYRLNGGEWQEYTRPIKLTADGIHTLEYRSQDVKGNVESVESLEVKIDKTAPALTVSVDKPILWSPNHKLVDIKAFLDYSDTTSGIDSVVLTSITVNEANALPTDIQGAAYETMDTDFSLRAERNGYDDGRIYTITYKGTDKAGNTTTGTATVTVPKSNSSK